MTKTELLHIIIVHTSRTWERIRLEQHNREMQHDNIESVYCILEVADKIIQEEWVDTYLNATDTYDYFMRNFNILSDTFIELQADKIIRTQYLN